MKSLELNTIVRLVILYHKKEKGFISLGKMVDHLELKIPESVLEKILESLVAKDYLMKKGNLYRLTERGRTLELD